MFMKLHIISLPYKYQISLLRPPGFILYHSSEAIKGNLSRSCQTERDQSKDKQACVLQRFLQPFFFFHFTPNRIHSVCKHYESFYEASFTLGV